MDIAPRYAPILMGFSNGIGTLAGLTCPFVTEKLTDDGPQGWVTVFVLASMIHFTGITFYGFYASGELQDWAEPKDEEWTDPAMGKQTHTVNYGSNAKQITDDNAPQPQNNDNYNNTVPQAYQSTAHNPFTAVWNDNQ